MNTSEESINHLKNSYQMLKDDFNNQKHDSFLLKFHVQDLLITTSNFKMNENIDFSRNQQQELINLIANIRNLISAIEKEIEIQTKEEFLISNNNEI